MQYLPHRHRTCFICFSRLVDTINSDPEQSVSKACVSSAVAPVGHPLDIAAWQGLNSVKGCFLPFFRASIPKLDSVVFLSRCLTHIRAGDEGKPEASSVPFC